MIRKLPLLFSLAIFLLACSSQRSSTGRPIKSIRFIDEYTLPHKMQFETTTVGGLSSIDYNSAEDLFYLICDDRSDINPARFYSAKIRLREKGIDTFQLVSVQTLVQASGQPFPNRKQDSLRTPDPEALRYNPTNQTIVWSSEGERIVRSGRKLLADPFIAIASKEGKLLDTFSLPPNLRMAEREKGPRQNGVLEGLAFANNYKTLFASVEEPLYEDGPRAGLNDTTGWIRIIKYDVASRQPVAQFAYQIDPVVQEPISRGTFIVNGVPDILALNDQQLLITERSFSTGRLTCNVRIYLAEIDGAEDIAGVTSLAKTPPRRPVRKKLVLNMDTLGRWVDNVEGATFGPRLPNGKRSLLLVTDDNFASFEKTQIFLFEVE
ncbi:esterase-like activity of phytase family protein [Flavisolibacter sp. BT320]|nr:esterase-like activity of phytase family protein [Flavisolibacter longurius]